ncbi:uncharacterized protein LOC118494676 isoform X1 [Sander lucioperca]|uniref:uncharacterized protein LOC118494676 isoform X1 n=1 Tax=Sander lucioperca TaxID=283035 RepID=UPI001653623D|nr:uncharacterized protein LOC118494676 isoform X1 [Sander lucioperca]XP_035855059.1 uncharacterized protein LOC118494676 isoform X1 [Sander lucioperca]
MAAVGAEATGPWFLSSGVVSVFLLLLLLFLLSIFLTALCSECSRRGFELRDSEATKDPSALIRVVKLEEAMVARENPMIHEIQNDEKDVQTNGSTAVMKTASISETAESGPEEDNSVPFTPWRSHLREPQNQDVHSSAPPDHIYHTIGGAVVSPLPTNQEPAEEHTARFAAAGDLTDRNSVYAKVSKKWRPPAPPDHAPAALQEKEEEESSPPLPDRKTQLEE